jgi:hypothetical protein
MHVGAVKAPAIQRSYPCIMSRHSVFGIAQSVFQVHGVDAVGHVVIRPVEVSRCPGVFREIANIPGWDRGLRLVATLVARTAGTRPYCAADTADLCEALWRVLIGLLPVLFAHFSGRKLRESVKNAARADMRCPFGSVFCRQQKVHASDHKNCGLADFAARGDIAT